MLPMQTDRREVETHMQIFLDIVSVENEEAYFDQKKLKALDGFAHYKTLNWEKPSNAVLFLRE